jgi:hypothetical protein
LQKVKPLRVAPLQDDLCSEGSRFSVRRTLPSRSSSASRDDQVTAAKYVPQCQDPYNRPLPRPINIRLIGNHQAHNKQIGVRCLVSRLTSPLSERSVWKGAFLLLWARHYQQTCSSYLGDSILVPPSIT